MFPAVAASYNSNFAPDSFTLSSSSSTFVTFIAPVSSSDASLFTTVNSFASESNVTPAGRVVPLLTLTAPVESIVKLTVPVIAS